MRRLVLFGIFIFCHFLQSKAQSITIVNSGGEAAGTNWSFTGNTITATADVLIDSSIINAHLNAGNNLKITTSGNINVNSLIRRTLSNTSNDSLVLESTAGDIYLGANITCLQSNQLGYMAITLSAANIYLTANCTLQSNAGTINIGTSWGTGNVNGNYDFKVDAICDNNPIQPARRISAPVNFFGSAGAITPLKTLNIVQSLGIGNPLLSLDGGLYKTTGSQSYKVAGLMSGNTLMGGIVLGQATQIITNGGNVIIGSGDTYVTSKSNGNHPLSITTTNLNSQSPYNDGYVMFNGEKFFAPANYNYVGDINITTYDGTGTPGDFIVHSTNATFEINIKGNLSYLGRNISLGQMEPVGPNYGARHLTINTNPTNSGNSGFVNLYNPSTQSVVVGPDYSGILRIKTKTSSGIAGDISIGKVAGAPSLSATPDSSIYHLTLDAQGTVASGTINLFGNLSTNGQGNNLILNYYGYTERGINLLGGQIKLMTSDMLMKVRYNNAPSGPIYLKGQFTSGHASNITNLITQSTTDSIYSGTVINTGGNITILTTKFINKSGSGALVVPEGKKWLVWSYNTNPFSGNNKDDKGGLPFNFKQYNASYDTSLIKGTGNGFLYKYAPTLSVGLTGLVSKPYDGSVAAPIKESNLSVTGLVDLDSATITTTSASYATSSVGSNIDVTAEGITLENVRSFNMPVYDYSLTNNSATADIGEITAVYANYPSLTENVSTIACGSTTANLSSITDDNATNSIVPPGAVISWHSESSATGENRIADPTQVAEGVYFAAYYFSASDTFSQTSITPVTVSKAPCLVLVNKCPQSTVNLNNLDSTQSLTLFTYISAQIGSYANGASLTYHSDTIATDANKLADTSSLGASVIYAAYSTGPGNFSPTAAIQISIQTFDNIQIYYKDSDGDGYGDASDSISACTKPDGYVIDNSDCDPSNAAKWRSANLFIDTDGDGYASGTASVCYGTNIPSGYRLNSAGTDCNDNNGAVNPGATEVCGNGIDENCNGQTDENCNVSCNFKTRSQSNWARASKTNPLTSTWFKTKFPSGLTIGGTTTTSRRIRFTTATAVQAFLPNSGTATFLIKDLINPAKSTVKNVFAGELLTLKLNIALNNGMSDAIIVSGTNKGMTVGQFVVECDKQISNANAKLALLSSLSTVCSKINGGYEDCNTGYLSCTSSSITLSGITASFMNTKINDEAEFVTISPNPSQNLFVLRNNNSFSVDVRILTSNGQTIENHNKLGAGSSFSFGSAYRPGMYIVVVKGNGFNSIKKMIKQ